jgi:hypothetical protein
MSIIYNSRLGQSHVTAMHRRVWMCGTTAPDRDNWLAGGGVVGNVDLEDQLPQIDG